VSSFIDYSNKFMQFELASFEMGSYYVTQIGFEVQSSSDVSTSDSREAGITEVHYHVW
jgi:hypothetical protein